MQRSGTRGFHAVKTFLPSSGTDTSGPYNTHGAHPTALQRIVYGDVTRCYQGQCRAGVAADSDEQCEGTLQGCVQQDESNVCVVATRNLSQYDPEAFQMDQDAQALGNGVMMATTKTS